jgi:Phage integrase family.
MPFVEMLESVYGKNVTLDKLKETGRDWIRAYHKIIIAVPGKYKTKKEYRELNFKELCELNVQQSERYSHETLKNHFTTVKGLLTWMEDEGYFEKTKQLKDILIIPKESVKSARRAIYDDELKKIFSREQCQKHTDRYNKPWKFWVPLMGLFTGCRIEEICQLELDDFFKDEQTQRWCIRITEAGTTEKAVKSKAGNRVVPLHLFLSKKDSPANLIKYVEVLRKQGETRLFPMLERNKRGITSDCVSKWFGREVETMGFNKSEVVFHSFRHTFVTAATHKNVNEKLIKQVVGHEMGNGGNVTINYTHAFPLKLVTNELVDVLDFDTRLDLNNQLEGVFSING